MAAANLLPDDVMEEILRRVAPSPRSLAACRVVCKAWRAVVDTRCPPPHPDLLPLSLAGIFFTTFYYPLEDFPGFFARRGCHHRARISPKLDYLEAGDHCNGLLLMCEYVVNPATRRWARLPPTPEWSGLVGLETTTMNWWGYEYLVFDPTMSPHYEVFSIPQPHGMATPELVVRQHEWPPSPLVVQVYSSATGRWEKRSLVRQGEAAGTIGELHKYKMLFDHLYGVYWRGGLYVQMKNNDVIRITLSSDDKYRVIKSPSDLNLDNYPHIYLGRSKKGIYCASLHRGQYQHLQVWLLHEPHGDQMEYWMLIHDANLDEIMADFRWNPDHQALIRPWVQHDMRRFSKKREEISSQDIDESGGGWDSEDDSIVYTEDMVGWGRNEFTCILGFHPFREIIFLYEPREEVRAYHLHNSKVEVLGTIDLFEFPDIIGRSFPYTPCWIGDLS